MTRSNLEIVDPVHGVIQADETEKKIIDSWELQRLRHIGQLSGAHLVYPGARHSRFEHSLGTMHIAGITAQSLRERGFVTESQARQIRLAGLVHDIGHGPYSHLFESVMRRHKVLGGADHEEIGRMVLEETEVGDLLGRDRRNVADLAFGGKRYNALSDIVSGVMGADTMDYLLRDGYFTGSQHARVDHQRLGRSIEIRKNRIVLARSSLHSFESMMHSRRQMFLTVYFHRTVRAAQAVMLEALEVAADWLHLEDLSLDDYLELTEGSLMAKMADYIDPYSIDARRVGNLVDEYQARYLPKCVLDVPITGAPPDAGRLRQKIAARAGVYESRVLVDVTGASSLPLTSDKRQMRSIALHSGPRHAVSVVPFSKLPLVSALLTPISSLRVYARSNTKKVAEVAASVWPARKSA